MQRIERLPQAFYEFRRFGGVLEFAVFEDADNDEKSAIEAAASVVQDLNQEKLAQLGAKRIDENFFYGEWYCANEDSLVRVGSYRTKDGRQLTNPRYRELEGISIVLGASNIPIEGDGGQFAYAFCEPPYGLKASPGKVQELFRAVRDFILPPDTRHEISDWCSPRLTEVSDYFSAGMDWWGVFLFTIYVPELRRLTAIAGSSTD